MYAKEKPQLIDLLIIFTVSLTAALTYLASTVFAFGHPELYRFVPNDVPDILIFAISFATMLVAIIWIPSSLARNVFVLGMFSEILALCIVIALSRYIAIEPTADVTFLFTSMAFMGVIVLPAICWSLPHIVNSK